MTGAGLSRRGLLAGAASGAVGLAGWARSEADQPGSGDQLQMVVTDIEQFRVHVLDPGEEPKPGEARDYTVYKVSSDAGICGYCFGTGHPLSDLPRVREMLVGKDPFAIESYVSQGLCQVSSWEHALWDLIGKACGLPAFKMLGGPCRDKIKVYLTTVWPGNPDQSDVSFERQAEDIQFFYRHGFHGVKIRCWRENPMDDVEALKHIRRAVSDDFAVMFDRTAQRAPWVWSYDQALAVARAMEEHGAYWLEEPFERENYTSSFRPAIPTRMSPSFGSIARSARLREAVGLRITGGEGDNDTHMFGQYLAQGAFDILQPDSFLGGGILVCHKIGMMAQAFGCDMILHGTHGLRLAGSLQVDAASPMPYWQELVMTTPGVLPQETIAPGMRLLRNKDAFAITDGYMHIPQGPGLGLDIDEDALEHYRVRRESR